LLTNLSLSRLSSFSRISLELWIFVAPQLQIILIFVVLYFLSFLTIFYKPPPFPRGAGAPENASGLYSEGARIESRQGICYRDKSVAWFSSCPTGRYLKLGHGRFLLHPFQIIIH
jgi:hypothetical protein